MRVRIPPVPSLAALLTLALVGSGCAGAPRAVPPAAPSAGSESGPGSSTPVWRIPPEAYPSQRLFRMEVESAEDRGTLKVVLRVEHPERYRLTLSDRLGRTLYTLDAAPVGGWLLDHRERRVCPLEEGSVLRGVPLEPLSPAALVAVLLGRVPVAPAGAVGPGEAGREGELSYRDAQGRRWDVRVEPGDGGRGGRRVTAWTLRQAGRPILWWRRDGDDALLSDRERGVQVRWRELAREPMGSALPEPEIPQGFEQGSCPDGTI